MKSNLTAVAAQMDALLAGKNEAAAIVLENNIKATIRDMGLIDTGRYISSITHDSDASGAIAGTNVKTYPVILELGSRYIQPYAPMVTGAQRSIDELRGIYGA